ncbi:helix-turn-helix domain-containing protein [Pricia sp.]|uniref:helix-turn-helix domain-containing protein n=1 Tax=Pricia sp. TaxID=2268138 RepID=UPI003593B08D
MVNSSDFIERLEHLLQYYDLNASAFADKIQVQRSSISHLLSGRNKPSLEFVLKVIKNFPEVNLYWLLNGKGTFPSETSGKVSPTPHPSAKSDETNIQEIKNPGKTIERIVIFYSDGSFEAYDDSK